MSADPLRLDRLFNPESIAIIGASEHGMYPAGILRSLIDAQYPGAIYPVNPGRDQVFGLACYPKISALPSRADLAVLVVNREQVLAVAGECARAGVNALVIITAGFSESDERGKNLQSALSDLAWRSGLTVLGPNCAGFANLPARVVATRLPFPSEPGKLSLLSQSGALMMALYGSYVDRCMRMNKILSVGNQMDVEIGEALQYLASDPSTELISIFLEGFTDGRGFLKGLDAALRNAKPVVIVKSGRTQSGSRIAATHTAAVAGSDRVFQSVCRQFGAILVEDVNPMMDVLEIQNAFGRKISKMERCVILTQSGGMGSLTADLFDRAGMTMPPLGGQLLQKLKGITELSHITGATNPVDIRGSALRGDATQRALLPFFEDAETDLLFLILARTTTQEADFETARAVIRLQQETRKPLLVVWTGQRHPPAGDQQPGNAERLFRQAGIPVFLQSSDAVRALAVLRRYWAYRAQFARSEGMGEEFV